MHYNKENYQKKAMFFLHIIILYIIIFLIKNLIYWYAGGPELVDITWPYAGGGAAPSPSPGACGLYAGGASLGASELYDGGGAASDWDGTAFIGCIGCTDCTDCGGCWPYCIGCGWAPACVGGATLCLFILSHFRL